MRLELTFGGHDVQFLSINMIDAEDTQENLINKCSFPLFQDVASVDAWGLHGGNKDHFFVYDKKGVLKAFLPVSGDLDVTLSEDEGYKNLKDAILDVIAGK